VNDKKQHFNHKVSHLHQIMYMSTLTVTLKCFGQLCHVC